MVVAPTINTNLYSFFYKSIVGHHTEVWHPQKITNIEHVWKSCHKYRTNSEGYCHIATSTRSQWIYLYPLPRTSLDLCWLIIKPSKLTPNMCCSILVIKTTYRTTCLFLLRLKLVAATTIKTKETKTTQQLQN